MILGFTGTRDGLSTNQVHRLEYFITQLTIVSSVHHGDCLGADSHFHTLIERNTDARIFIHPPRNDKYRAWCVSNEILPVKEYLDRNKDIVDACEFLVACPKEAEEQVRSGTWSTVRYAREIGCPTLIIYP